MPRLIPPFPGTRPPGRSALTAQLLDALARPGCPLCRVVETTGRRHLAALLDARILEPDTHRQFLASRGLCTAHTWALPAAALEAQAAPAVATLYAYLLADLLRGEVTPDRLRWWLGPDRACPLCQLEARTAAAYLAEFAQLLGQRCRALDDSPAALCLPHLGALAPHADARQIAPLRALTAAALRAASPARHVVLTVGPRPTGAIPAACGCPVCAAAARASATSHAATDLCRAHTWARFDAGHMAVGVASPTPRGPCPACRSGAEAAEAALATRQSAHRLCLGHLRRALGRDWLDYAVVYWSLVQLERDLVRFADSANAAFPGTLSEAERRAWRTALARCGGEVPDAGLARPATWPASPARPGWMRRLVPPIGLPGRRPPRADDGGWREGVRAPFTDPILPRDVGDPGAG